MVSNMFIVSNGRQSEYLHFQKLYNDFHLRINITSKFLTLDQNYNVLFEQLSNENLDHFVLVFKSKMYKTSFKIHGSLCHLGLSFHSETKHKFKKVDGRKSV